MHFLELLLVFKQLGTEWIGNGTADHHQDVWWTIFNRSVRDCSYSSALAMGLQQSCTMPSITFKHKEFLIIFILHIHILYTQYKKQHTLNLSGLLNHIMYVYNTSYQAPLCWWSCQALINSHHYIIPIKYMATMPNHTVEHVTSSWPIHTTRPLASGKCTP